MAFFPSAIATDADLYTAKNALQTTLATGVNSIITSIVLSSATGFPTAGAVVIGTEVIFYTNISGSTLTGCTRGADGTTAASHSVGVPVGAAIVAFHHNGLMAEIESIETHLGVNGANIVHIAGAETITGLKSFTDDIKLASTKKFYLDGGDATYLTESSDNIIDVFCNGSSVANFAPAGVDIKGTTTNDDAATGWVGEEVRSSISSATNFPGTGTYGDITSISLTAGDWDISGILRTTLNGATMSGGANLGISTTSGTTTSGLVEGDNLISIAPPTASYGTSGSIPQWRLKISGTTTVYLKYKADFSAGTPQAFGRISARRRR